MKNFRKMTRWAAGGWICVLLIAAAGWAAKSEKQWFTMLIGDQKTGYIMQSRTELTDGPRPVIETRAESRIVLNRLGNRVEIYSSGIYRETADGELKAYSGESRLSAQAVETEVDVAPGELTVRTTLGGKVDTQTIEYEGVLSGPEGIRLLSLRSLKKEGDSAVFQMFSAELNSVIKVTRTAVSRETVTVSDEEISCLKVKDTYENIPMKQTAWLDAEGFEVKTSSQTPFGMITAIRSEKEEALFAGGAVLSDEVYERTLVRSNIRLPQARLLESVTLRLRHRSPDLGWPELEGEYQHVLSKDRDTLLLKIDRPEPGDPAISGVDPAEYLESNIYLESDHPLIQEKAREIIGDEKDSFRKALKLKNWVSRNMIFDLGITFAPSSEVMKSLKGTCTEYAVLLAALARAAGIPSRFLMGYVYVNGIWGGHAWAEVFVDGNWVPLDAAVNGPGAADPARIYFSRTSLDDDRAEMLMSGQWMYGNVDIDVVEYVHSGRRVRVDPEAPLFVIEGDRYVNPGLGIGIMKPHDFTFSDMDRVWPERVLVRMTGPGGETIGLLQDRWQPGVPAEKQARTLLDAVVEIGSYDKDRLSGMTVYRKTGRDKAAAVVINGVDAFVLEAEGKNAVGILNQVLPTLSFTQGHL